VRRGCALASLLAVAALTALASPPRASAARPESEPDECTVPLDPAPVDEGKDPGVCPHARAPRLPLAPELEGALLEAESDTDVTHYFLELEIIPEYTGSTRSTSSPPSTGSRRSRWTCTAPSR
jgi:hypothetical protein